MQSLGYSSVPPLLKYVRHAEQLGMAVEPALALAGLQAQQLSDNSLRVPGEAHERLLDYFCEHSGDPLFGLNSARFVLPNSWNVLGYITMNCATLGDAMNRIMPFEKLVGDMGVSRAEAQGEHVHLIWTCRHQRPRIRRHLVENVLGSWLQYARWIADAQLSPTAVWLEHPQPADTERSQYEQFFDCPVLFDQPYSALVVPLPYLQLPLRQADAQLLRTLEDHALGLMATLEDASLEQRVKNILRQLLKEGLPRKEQVAEQFAVSVRTLNWRSTTCCTAPCQSRTSPSTWASPSHGRSTAPSKAGAGCLQGSFVRHTASRQANRPITLSIVFVSAPGGGEVINNLLVPDLFYP
jgi:hypothetical protein